MRQKMIYWITTGLIAFVYGLGGYIDLNLSEDMKVEVSKLGYPLYFFSILGIWKLGAAVALLAPGLPRLKEWAYAGLLFNLTSASASHAFVGDPLDKVLPPLVILLIAITSWATRPADRKLAGPWL